MRALISVLATLLLATTALAQQLVQRGPLGKPASVFDQLTQQWSSPIEVAKASDVSIFIPDVSSPAWIQPNFSDFFERSQYRITLVTLYRSPASCRANQIAWGLGDAAHLNACATDIAYRTREATVDFNLHTVTLIQAAMLDPDGNLIPNSVETQSVSRTWAQLDPNTQAALAQATSLIRKQMDAYNARLNSGH